MTGMIALDILLLFLVLLILYRLRDIRFRIGEVRLEFSPVIEERRRLREGRNLSKQSDSDAADKSSRVRQLRGKYAHLRTNSDAFAAQKQEEIKLEDRR